jgi:hypothetical protein
VQATSGCRNPARIHMWTASPPVDNAVYLPRPSCLGAIARQSIGSHPA